MFPDDAIFAFAKVCDETINRYTWFKSKFSVTTINYTIWKVSACQKLYYKFCSDCNLLGSYHNIFNFINGSHILIVYAFISNAFCQSVPFVIINYVCIKFHMSFALLLWLQHIWRRAAKITDWSTNDASLFIWGLMTNFFESISYLLFLCFSHLLIGIMLYILGWLCAVNIAVIMKYRHRN
jgi:hypothetical protein